MSETELRKLLDQHQAHWDRIADALGLCMGGVDVPVDDPMGNAQIVIAKAMGRRPLPSPDDFSDFFRP